jgi:hypothetical protein
VQAHVPQAPAETQAPAAGTPGRKRATRAGTFVEGSKSKIVDYFKEKGVTKGSSGNIVYKGSRYNIPYDDFIYDLTHDFTRTSPNMTTSETQQALRFLKKIKMPTSHIRSNRLRSQYTSMREGGSRMSPPTPSSSNEESVTTPRTRPPSRIPIRSAPQQRNNRFPNLYNRRDHISGSHSQQLDRDIEALLRS